MKNTNEDTYKIFHGLKPVKRSHCKDGQSKYYYFDPRGADRFADFKEIDVASEDSPNPKITAILRDDIKKNERDYYIWRTRKDEKVRDRHKEREGKVFNWHVPPEGGHPGEDYNCRCWAEPYRADMAEQFNITPKFDLSGLPRYAENDKAGVKSDGTKSKKIDYSLYGEGFTKEFIDQMENDKEFQKALQEYVIPNEKGYVNNLKDPGGETNMGISKRYHPHEDIKNLTRERANAILYKEVWNWNGLNKLPREIRGFVFDHGVRTSPQNAIETTHRALGINPVGDIIGSNTLSLLQNIDYEEFLQRYQNLVKQQDKNNKNYQYFGAGWNNRTNGYHVSY